MRHELLTVSDDRVFTSFQGEGPTAGKSAVFLRTNECNLDCRWCDTRYTWDRWHPDYKKKQEWTTEETMNAILRASVGNIRRLIITGGEPLLQQKSLAGLCALPAFEGWDIEIETNGTRIPNAFSKNLNLQINCSPKLANSGVDRDRRRKPDILRTLMDEYNTFFKFVVTGPKDLAEIAKDFEPLGMQKDRIWISPEGTTAEAVDRVRSAVYPDVHRHQYKMGDRLHILLFGNERRR